MAGKKSDERKIWIPIAKDEMNLVEFPFALLSRYAPNGLKTIEINWDFRNDRTGERETQEWIVTGSDKYGLPTGYDNDVYIALMCLAREQGLTSRTVFFSRHQMVQLMHRQMSKREYRRLEEALHRLTGVSIHATNAFYDHQRKRYTTEAFGMLNSFYIEDERPRTRESQGLLFPGALKESPTTHAIFNEVLWKSIQRGYIKSIDTGIYFALETPIAKRLYRLLDKKKHQGATYNISLMKLAEKLPIRADYPCHARQKLNGPHQELLDLRFLEKVNYYKSGSTAMVRYQFTFEVVQEDDLMKEPELVRALVKKGVTLDVARQLVAEHNGGLIQYQLEVMDWLLKQPGRKVDNPGGYLRKAIEEGYQAPKAYEDAKHRAKARKKLAASEAEDQKKRERSEQEKHKEMAEFDAIWSKLPAEKQEALLDDVISLIPSIFRSRVVEARRQKRPMTFDELGLAYYTYVDERNKLLAETSNE